MSTIERSREFDRFCDFDRGGFFNPFDSCICVLNGCCECECLCGFRFFARKGRLFRSRVF